VGRNLSWAGTVKRRLCGRLGLQYEQRERCSFTGELEEEVIKSLDGLQQLHPAAAAGAGARHAAPHVELRALLHGANNSEVCDAEHFQTMTWSDVWVDKQV